jgi:type I restriction enzyme S subunit
MEKQLVPKLRFPEFESKWSTNKIGDYYENLRTGMTPYRGKPYYYEGNIPWITSGELNYNRITETRETISELALKETNLKLYPEGTLFIAITGLEAPGTRGRCAINNVPSTTNQSCLALEKIPEIETVFLYYWYLKYGEWLYS